MNVRTEFEIRFIFDASKPIASEERDYLLGAIEQWGKFRALRGDASLDVHRLRAAVAQMPAEDLPPAVDVLTAPPEDTPTFRERRNTLDRVMIQKALQGTGGHQAEAARLLGIPLRTFTRKLKQLGLVSGRAP